MKTKFGDQIATLSSCEETNTSTFTSCPGENCYFCAQQSKSMPLVSDEEFLSRQMAPVEYSGENISNESNGAEGETAREPTANLYEESVGQPNPLGNAVEQKQFLMQLKKTRPPGYTKFESALNLDEIEDDIACKLWLDIFKPLDYFELCRKIQLEKP